MASQPDALSASSQVTLLGNALCVDPAAGINEPTMFHILIIGDKISKLFTAADTSLETVYAEVTAAEVTAEVTAATAATATDSIVFHDCEGKLVLPGLFDMHVHLRDPGQQYKETIASGSRSAAVGGFTGVLAMPNTDPVIDNASLVAYVYEQAQATALTRIYCSGALSSGQKGESLAEMAGMQQAGAIAFTDDGKGVQDSGLMRLALEYASSIGAPVLSHCQFNDLVGSGQINEGVMSTRLGLAGWPAAGEELQIARDIALAELTGAALHIQHVSTARGAELVREAKARGISVTAEVTPHHLFLNETALDERYDTNLKMNPPLRTKADCEALIAALLDGTIDCVATDHAPHAAHEKQLEFELASFGVTGLETALALMLDQLVATGVISLATLVERMAHAPRRILGLAQVNLSSGSQADLTIVDLDKQWVVEADGFESRSNNSAFLGWHLKGKASDVLVGGRFTLKEGIPV